MEGKVTLEGKVTVDVEDRSSPRPVLDTPSGIIRNAISRERHPVSQFFACKEYIAYETPTVELPDAIANGKEPCFVVGGGLGR